MAVVTRVRISEPTLFYSNKEFIIDLRNLLLKLKDKDEINIILHHTIDTKSNIYIAQKWNKINSILKEKDK